MSNKRQGRVFAVVVMAALGLMAMMASGASAQWLEVIEGTEKSIPKNLLVEVGLHSEHSVLVVPEKELLILCKKITGEDVLLISGSSPPEATGSVLFHECVVYQKEVLASKCTVDLIKAGGKAHLILHGTSPAKNYLLFEPTVVGGNFATIKFLGAECALPESNNVKGTLVAECLETENASGEKLVEVDCLKPMATHLLREALNAKTLFPTDGLIYAAASPASLVGVASAKLSGGAVWSGHV